ncbi:tripartite tricarboxylate transporter substrate binding protein [Xylophilus sp.]|uniref:tripartite tricarboxylate transporter substrate binding protein n=1 Tax=Xylophilus sp. TaxID=2653893 RepID=UPI0013B68F7C|nr:tripartite tricarboxylate transporter substrate binding protein [Xylophilus sp.]KAF1048571.1 MAG: hypothetical protein GAK38_01322 [Xylophilus sp.]
MHLIAPGRRQALAAAAVAVLAPALPAAAQQQPSWPSRPIQLIVSFAPGGGTDLLARLLARHLEKQLGAAVVVQNRPGAGGAIGLAETAKAAPDGYTLGIINTPPLMTLPIERKTSFSWSGFDLLGNLVDDPVAFAVPQSSAFPSLASLVAYAKAHPDEVTAGTGGAGTDDHLGLLLFERAAGVRLCHVPYKGASDVRVALMGGQVMVGVINFGKVLQFQKAGTALRFLGQAAAARSPMDDKVPTFREQGYDVLLSALRGVGAPKGLPEPVRHRLAEAIARIVADPEFKAQAESMFAPLRYLRPDAYLAEVKKGDAEFRQLWKEIPWNDQRS